MLRFLVAATLPLLLLASCAAGPSTLATVQVQATAAVADLQVIGATLAARGSVDPATELRLMAAVAVANAQFQSVQPGSGAASGAAALLASALTEMQTVLPTLPAADAALLDAASAALAAYAGSGLAA